MHNWIDSCMYLLERINSFPIVLSEDGYIRVMIRVKENSNKTKRHLIIEYLNCMVVYSFSCGQTYKSSKRKEGRSYQCSNAAEMFGKFILYTLSSH